MHPQDSIGTLPKTGPKLLKSLTSLGICTITDLLYYFPSRYLDFSKFTHIIELTAEDTVTIRGHIKSIAPRFNFRTRKTSTEAVVSDATGSIKVTWFNQSYVASALEVGDEILLSGKVVIYKTSPQLINPIYEKITAEHIHTGRLVPVYRLADGVYPKTFRSLVFAALPAAAMLEDILPYEVKLQHGLIALADAIHEMHFPKSPDEMKEATKRFTFQEMFIQQLAVVQYKQELKKLAAPSIPIDIPALRQKVTSLSFSLTESQKKALWDIAQDLAYKHPMNRLLQGDVGSGKTIVAVLAALGVIDCGYQVVLLAPTEILAKQHYQSLSKTLTDIDRSVTLSLYTRSLHYVGNNKTTRKAVLQSLKNGSAELIVGTHALLEGGVDFHSLAFVIVDEQHRFGVQQRRQITKMTTAKIGSKTKPIHPHLLSMSATPIPRSAALALYGDLDLTTINELPKGRLPIKTWVVPEHKRSGAYEFIKNEIAEGRQAFIITPLVEESERLAAKSAKAEFQRLAKVVFPTHSLGLLYGGMKAVEKTKVMQAFAGGAYDILVTTSVVEVGIDVPNASIIMIENADRFGLAQLHQLRGRVGRGKHQSYCLLFSDTPTSAERLALFARTQSGFALAEYDLKTRGFGALFGSDQTGFAFKFGQYLNVETIAAARASAEQLLKKDPGLRAWPALKKQVLPLTEKIHLE